MTKGFDDESSRLLSYLISVYEVLFGFVIAGGVIGQDPDMTYSLIKAGVAFFLAGVGLHFFVNPDNALPGEFRRKSRSLAVGVLALLGGIAAAVHIGQDAFSNHIFFLVYVLGIVSSFVYMGAVRRVFVLGAGVYGFSRLLSVYAGTVIAGQMYPAGFDERLPFIIISYAAFHVICEFLRWSAAARANRLAVLTGFMSLLGLLTYMFYAFSNTLEDIRSKLIVMTLVLMLLALVAFPPLHAIRTMRAMPLLSIFPKGLAGGIVLTLIYFIVLHKPGHLLFLVIIPVLLMLFQYRSGLFKGKDGNETET